MTTTKTDRELLELAAKAIGLDAEFHPELGYGDEGMWLKGERTPDNSKYWNPLNCDGDSARLESSLQMHVIWNPGLDRVVVGPAGRECVEPYDGDRQYARRRAGVRAAAAIGEAMP